MATFRSYPPQSQAGAGSQESLASYSSGTATTGMATSASEASQATDTTHLTSPNSTSPRSAGYFPKHDATMSDVSPKYRNTHHPVQSVSKTDNRLRTPENQSDASGGHSALTSPMSLTTPINGHKRMASGQVKHPEQSHTKSPADASRAGAARAASVSSTGSKASEVAANLKDRLAYAMAKVQHGWEHHNIDEVERLAAAAISPRTVISPRYTNGKVVGASPRSAGFPSRALVNEMPGHRAPYYDQQIKSAPLPHYRARRSSSDESMSPPAKRRPVHDSVTSQHGVQHSYSSYQKGLAPAADLGVPPSPHCQTGPHHVRQGSSQSQGFASSPTRHFPNTPKANRRPATIRTQTQTAQAEQEAMDALLLMGSPSNGGAFPRSSQQSSATQSPRHRTFAAQGPRQALQYRSKSNESITSNSSAGIRNPAAAAEIMRQRGSLLDQIEAES